jgi:hypothetical protein
MLQVPGGGAFKKSEFSIILEEEKENSQISRSRYSISDEGGRELKQSDDSFQTDSSGFTSKEQKDSTSYSMIGLS